MTEPKNEDLDDHQPPDQTAEPPLTRPGVMPELYSGTECRFRDWFTTFELCAELNDCNLHVRRKFLVVRLSGLAREMYDILDDATRAGDL